MATQEDRTLSAGMSFPKWMKSKMNDRLDLDQSTFSPTELDDSFMHYYRHPPAKNDPKMPDTKVVKASPAPAVKVDFSNTSTGQFVKSRPKGTDDGFKSEASQVGSNILRVANQIVSGKPPRGNTPEPAEECEQLLAKFDPYRRRGSKSLPASPLSSPKSKRRMNKFFTSPYVETDKSKGWILSSLLAKREISQSMGFIGEEKKDELERASSTLSVDEQVNSSSKLRNQVYKAKPSELREMNFWSPTSM
ncbi:uncharacterized protein [Euwallacea fornicatus]|uniref:uncharacterized protein isoform X1 n=2 Tax=Euwallacea fornicatus TaxID=995702 RepID=UPI00338F1102